MVNLLWGISFPAIKATNMLMDQHSGSVGNDQEESAVGRMVSRVVSASFLMTVRFAVALVMLGVFVPRLFQGMTAAQWWMGAWVGLSFVPGFLLQIMAMHEIPASRSGFLTSLSVVFTPVLMIAVERRPPRWPVTVGAGVALLGTAILTGLVGLGGSLGLRLTPNALERTGIGDWLTVLAAFIF